MYSSTRFSVAIAIATITLVSISGHLAHGQVFDQLFRSVRGASEGDAGYNNELGVRNERPNQMGIRIPMFYDMTRNGNSLGINVLSGLVKVERGEEATRSGLSGPRPLSVRIFGIPVYERGTRISAPDSGSYQPEYETPSNINPVPQGPDGPTDPAS